MSDLPPGWEWATLGEIASSVKNGIFVSRPGTEPNGVPILRISSVRSMQLDIGDVRYSEREVDNLREQDALLHPDDLLFTRYNGNREYVGVCARVPEDIGRLTYPDKLIRVRVPAIDSRYLAAAFASPIVRPSVDQVLRTTAGQVGISGRSLKDIRIPIAPLAEQRRITTAIEDHLSRLDAGVTELHKVERKLKLLERRILSDAIFDKSSNWPRVSVGSMSKVTTGTTPLKSRADYYDGGDIPWITSSQLNDRYIVQAERFITRRALEETSLKILPPGTILVAMYGEGRTRGKCSELVFPATINQACAAIVLNKEHEEYRAWVKAFFEANYESNRRLSAGGVQPNLNLGLIKSITLPLPPVEKLTALLARLDDNRDMLNRLMSEVNRMTRLAGGLRQSLLAEAFTGRLVPQDPTDEPASALLKRIQAERSAQLKRNRTRRAENTTQETLL